MTVYVLYGVDYGDFDVLGVFTTLEGAQQHFPTVWEKYRDEPDQSISQWISRLDQRPEALAHMNPHEYLTYLRGLGLKHAAELHIERQKVQP